MIRLQQCREKEKWDDFVMKNGGHPLQLWAWGQVKSEHGWRVDRILGYDANSEVVAAAQVLVRTLPFPLRAFAYVPRGPVSRVGGGDHDPETVGAGSAAQTGEFLDAVAQHVKREHHAVALSIEPDAVDFTPPAGWVESENTVLSPETVLLDLTQSEADLLAHMAKKRRQYIRKSGALVETRELTSPEDFEECLDIYQQTARRADFGLHDLQYYRDVHDEMADHSPIFGAYKDGTLVSFLWLGTSATTAYELYGGMNQEGQDLRANYALKWYAIRKAKEWGMTRYDFGGLVAGGVAQFKHGWSEEFTTFAGTFDKPLSPFYLVWNKGLPLVLRTVRAVRARVAKS